MDQPPPVRVFVNPSAGRGRAGRKAAAVRAAFARRNFRAEVIETASAEDFIQQVRQAKAEGCRTIVAMGGDGTLQILVREVIGRKVMVGVIPTGSGNDFAAALGISENPDTAVSVIVNGRTRQVDVACVKLADGVQRIYLGGGGMGLDAEAARLAGGRFLMWPGRIRYLASAIAALRRFEGIDVQAEFLDGETQSIRKTVLLAVALNTPTYGGGLRLAPQAQTNDGKLDLVLVDLLQKRQVLALIPRLLITGDLKTEKVMRIQAERVRLSAAGQAWFQGDGELLGRAPVEISVLPGALQMLVP